MDPWITEGLPVTPGREGLVTTGNKEVGSQEMRGGEASEIPHLRRSSGKEKRKDARRPSRDWPSTRDVVAKRDEVGASDGSGASVHGARFSRARGRGGGFEWGRLLKGETVSQDRGLRERKPWGRGNVKALRHRHFPAPTRLPHTLTASPPSTTAPVAATRRRSRTYRASPPRDSPGTPPRPPHVTRRPHPLPPPSSPSSARGLGSCLLSRQDGGS